MALVVACAVSVPLPSCGEEEDERVARDEAATSVPVVPPPPDSDPSPWPAMKGCAVRFRWEFPEGVDSTVGVRAWWEEADAPGVSTLRPVARGSEHVVVGVPPGDGIVMLHVPGCVAVQRAVSAEADVTTDAGTITFRRCKILEGRVVDEDGAPIDGAFLWPQAGDLSVPLTGTDKDGRFAFDGLPDGEVQLRVESDDHVRRTVVVRNGPGVAPEAIVLDRGGEVAGLVVDAEGRPDADAYVWIVDPLDDENRDRMAWPSVESDGTFSVHLAPGRYRVSARSDDGSGSVTVEVHEGKTTDARLILMTR